MKQSGLKRCAIYVRKSSERGLEQQFNSLDAQREACEAYVKSQAQEGWVALTHRYDDGGFSGGSMERPALRRLLADVEAGRIDTVVVYKIDRLTRRLSDFAQIVDLLDRHVASFVSVTQAFNTTSSMGRLTLNVLLSFAQFEREVTGERIRDKIAASKAKGLWMGGIIPLGYDAPVEGTRILQVNEREAILVRRIFRRYLELRSVSSLVRWLEEAQISPKQWKARNGRKMGATKFNRGALYCLLRNHLYRGMIRHKSAIYAGSHSAIVDAKLFERVQNQLDQAARRLSTKRTSLAKAPLAGRIFDAEGRPMGPAGARGKCKRLYRYYATSKVALEPAASGVQRIPGVSIENQLCFALERLLPKHYAHPLALIRRVEIRATTVLVLIEASLECGLTHRLLSGESISVDPSRSDWLRIELPLRIRSRRGRTSIQLSKEPETCFDGILIGALRRAHALVELDGQCRPVLHKAPSTLYERRLIRLAFLAPDLQSAVLEGRQPAHLSLEQLIERPIPIEWEEQRAIFQLDSPRPKLRQRNQASTLAIADA